MVAAKDAPKTPNTLKMPLWCQRECDDELVARFLGFCRPAPLVAVFHGLRPRWAVESLARLLAAGRVVEDGKTGRGEVVIRVV